MKPWRPDDWGKYYHPEGIGIADPVSIAFEAGADAMLEVLRKRGDKTTVTETISGNPLGKLEELSRKTITGYLVFIPDEEK